MERKGGREGVNEGGRKKGSECMRKKGRREKET